MGMDEHGMVRSNKSAESYLQVMDRLGEQVRELDDSLGRRLLATVHFLRAQVRKELSEAAPTQKTVRIARQFMELLGEGKTDRDVVEMFVVESERESNERGDAIAEAFARHISDRTR